MPADVNGNVVEIAQIATGEVEGEAEEDSKDTAVPLKRKAVRHRPKHAVKTVKPIVKSSGLFRN